MPISVSSDTLVGWKKKKKKYISNVFFNILLSPIEQFAEWR